MGAFRNSASVCDIAVDFSPTQLVTTFSYFRLTPLILLCAGVKIKERARQAEGLPVALQALFVPETSLLQHSQFRPMPVYMTYGVWALYCQSHLECIFLINKSTFKL